MPEISRFYGIVIRMYFNDHAQQVLADDEARIEVEPETKLF